jgi:hypothetical protein
MIIKPGLGSFFIAKSIVSAEGRSSYGERPFKFPLNASLQERSDETIRKEDSDGRPKLRRTPCAMHRGTDRTIIDLFFTTDKFLGTPRICEPTKCDGLAFFPMNALPQPLAGYIGVALEVYSITSSSPLFGLSLSERIR